MLKKMFCAVIVLLLLLNISVLVLSAASVKTGAGFEYSISGDKAEIIKYIGSDAEVVVPDELEGCKVASIGTNAFSGNKNIENIVLPDTVTMISNGAFMSCTNLKSFEMSKNVRSISWEVFAYCENLSEITLPVSLQELGINCFMGCKSLKSISVEEGNKSFCSDGGNLYNADKTRLIQYAAGKTDETFSVPDTVQAIGESAFASCGGLRNINLPEGLKTIEDSAFESCVELSEISIPESVNEIGFGIFMNCENLSSVTIPNSLESIGMYTFNGCKKLESVKLPDNLKSIGDCTFYDCTNLKSVIIPDGVTTIGHDSFYYCSNLCELSLPDGLTCISEYAFGYCTSLENVTLGAALKTVEQEAFWCCDKLKSITVLGVSTKLCDWKSYSIVDDCVTRAHSGSYAESYAKNNNRLYSSLDKPVSIKELDFGKLSPKTYSGKALKQKIIIKNNHHNLVEAVDFSATYKNNTKAGKATVTIRGKGDYTGTVIKSFSILKASNPVKVTVKKSLKASAQKKTKIKNAINVKNAKGKVTYITNNKKVVVKNGAFIVNKRLKKGKTYSVKVKVNAAGTNNYKSATKTVVVKIKAK